MFMALLITWLYILPHIRLQRLKKRLEAKYNIKIPKKLVNDLDMYDRIIAKYKSSDKEWAFMKGKTQDELLLYFIIIGKGKVPDYTDQNELQLLLDKMSTSL